MIAKRLFDLFFAGLGLIVLAPLFLVVAIWIKIDSPGPVFFRQVRIGRFGREFRIFKFRTMCVDAEAKGRQITVGNDPRITRSGELLRGYKLDELPQLINVVTGEMSLVGPRPEVPRYVALYPEEVKKVVLSVPPGITDNASIEFRHENDILASAENPEKTYVEQIMPIKLAHYRKYAAERSLLRDIMIIFMTFRAIVCHRSRQNV